MIKTLNAVGISTDTILSIEKEIRKEDRRIAHYEAEEENQDNKSSVQHDQ